MTGKDRESEAGKIKAGGKLLAVLGLCVLVLWSATGQAQDRRLIADVAIIGNRNISTDQIMRYLSKTRPGKEFTIPGLQEDVSALYATNMFKRVDPDVQDGSDGRVQVIFKVQEYPNLIQDIIYKNARHIKQADLDSLVKLRKGMPLDPHSNRRACFEIQEYLRNKNGRYFANVTLEEGNKASDQRVVFNIAEGPVVRVRKVRFEGNESLATSARLKTQIDTGQAFLRLPLGGKFLPPMIDNDVLKLEEYYKNNGYLDVSVTRELVFSDDYRWVDIVFHIREGQRYRIGEVTVSGASQLKDKELLSFAQVRPGKFYNKGQVSGDLRNITDYYGWRGFYVSAQEELLMVPDPQDPGRVKPGVVHVQYEIKEKAPARVGNIYITGNEVTRNNVILRVGNVYPGQILRFPELRIWESNLARLNLFEMDPDKGGRPTVTVIENPENDSEYKDILVTVKETHTGSFLLGAGINSNAGFVGSIVLNERNFDITRVPTSLADIFEGRAFRGAGQEFRLEAVPGTQLQRYSATFRDPFVFDTPYSLTLGGYYYNRVFNEYVEGRVGGRVTVGRQLNLFNKALSINAGARIENVNVSNLAPNPPADYTSVLGDSFVVGPRVGLTFDTRDSFLRPTVGGLVEASYEQVLGKFNFPIFNVEGSRYFTTYQRPDASGKHVLAARGHFAWAGNDAPVFERFFAGGFNSLRGFQFRGVGPNDNGFMVGGQFMLLGSLEYQVPILANDQLYAVAFLDSGTVERQMEIRDYRISAGVGLRIVVPMFGPVPIALDFGFPIAEAQTDRKQLFSFWIGMFR